MPANRASFQVTEKYRRGMVDIRHRAQAEARQAWRQIDPDRIDATYPVGMLALTVSILQRQAAQLSAGYVQAFVRSERGEKVPVPLVDARMVGEARNGDKLRDALRSPVIGAKVGIGEGKTPQQALAEGGRALERIVGLSTDTAARDSLLRVIDSHPKVSGWQRAVKGTCGACAATATGPTEGLKFEVHPSCQCVSEPVVEPLPAEFGKTVKKGQRVEAANGQEFKKGKWTPVDEPIRGAVIKENETSVMLQLGSGSKVRYISANRSALAPIERARSAQETLRASLAQSRRMFPLSERNAMLDYTGGKGSVAEELNRSLRAGRTGGKHSAVRESLDDAFDRVPPLSQEGVVYRGTKVKGARQFKPGTVIEDNGFMSTTPARSRGEDFVAFSGGDLFEITMPKGTKAIDVNRAAGSRFGKERELLLPRGTRMVVESIEPHPTRPGRRVIHVRVLS